MHHTHLSNLPPIQMFFLIAVLFIGLAVYFYPTIHAIRRNSQHTTAVVILNVFFGFTLIGWIVALLLATKQPQVVIVYNPPRPPTQ